MDNINNIKERIHAINPQFTDELLELLREYIFASQHYTNIEKIKEDKNFEQLIKGITLQTNGTEFL